MGFRIFVIALAAVLLLGGSTTNAQAAARTKTIYPCKDHLPFYNTTLTIVTTVKAPYNTTWAFPEAPSVLAQRLLTGLNNNSKSITFKEANGVIPNLYINVLLTETNTGTQQDRASVESPACAPGTLFTDTSGPAPYIGWRDAIDHLATNMIVWFEGGWHTEPPCRLPDGGMRTHWP